MSSASYGLSQGLQRATVTRGLAAGPERFEGGQGIIACLQGAAIGCIGGWGGANSEDLEGSSPVQRQFFFKNFGVGAFPQPWRIVAAVL